MLLAVDAGNTNIKFAIFSGSVLRVQWKLHTDPDRTADEYSALFAPLFSQAQINNSDIDQVIITSVVPRVVPALTEFSEKILKQTPIQVSPQLDIGLHIAYDPPEAVGADRLVDSAAAIAKYGAPCIVIDFGTATTFNAIASPANLQHDENNYPVYLGGAICLGISVSLEALFAKAAKIPPVILARPPQAIGQNTTHALQSGIIFGYASLVNGMVNRIRAELGAPNCPVIATGGNASLIAHETDCITAVEPELTLEGLRLIAARV